MGVMSSPAEQLMAAFREANVRHRSEEPLSRYTTIRLGGPAELMAFPASTSELISATGIARERGVPLRVLGAGSNLLVGDDGVRGVVVHTGAMKVLRFGEGGSLEAEAGVYFPGLVRAAVSRGLRGLEGGVGIPGSVGGVVAMNAGAYGFSIGERVGNVSVVSPSRGRMDLGPADFDFHYRSSSFGDDVIVAGCRLELVEDDPRAVREDMNRHMRVRKTTQPVGVKSAGCIFKNPEADSAGRIIDSLGLKGFRVGGVRISEVHANFIVHDGATRMADVVSLIEQVKEKVYRETRVVLEEEVKLWR